MFLSLTFLPLIAFPLIFIKPFQKSCPADREALQTIPKADCDFEEITIGKKEAVRL